MTQYIIRLDDFSRFSKLEVWERIIACCRMHKVRCLIGVVAECEDSKIKYTEGMNEHDFWVFVKRYTDMDVAIHGFKHEIFGGKSFAVQLKLMTASMKKFIANRIIPDCFIPPKHVYDNNTLRAMKSLGINYLSDGIGLYPWRHIEHNIIQVPQVLWRPRRIPIGVITFCLHPDRMSESEITNLMEFIEHNKNDIISIYDVDLTPLEFINIPFEPIYLFLYKRRFLKQKQ